ncbi:MAG: preprotein translocase subunit SecA [Gammaproteobacteria bacterium RIFCSPHIGHO2_12_FULL_42_10]|nr:MAG: preprotein translocase subunit SecA [Gammaproteobacteria bacterium RIFCSPHIGHO2_12_FULL_42_10]
MFNRLLTTLFGSRNQRVLSRHWKIVKTINALEPALVHLSEEALRAKTDEFRAQLKAGVKLNALLPEAFAVVREAAKRTLNMRHFDEQLIGGMVLHEGNIAEMRTGEGKTLMSTLAIYLNALPGEGVHVVTINDYLAKRDTEWMRPIYEALGLIVGTNLHGMQPHEKQAAYRADITYGTNNEFGFDYLRDNMVFQVGDKVQRRLHHAIVDEVDSILIDEARTPLIISGIANESTDLYLKMNTLVPSLARQNDANSVGDYHVDEKSKQAFLSEAGHQHVEALFVERGLLHPGESLYDARNMILMHHLYAALRAHALFHRDHDYIVKQNEVIIVDEHTGRTMPGRRWSDGLHQAIEAKEQVKINQENQTLASITFQNYFRLYQKLSGMTGTADTEAYEFQQIYGLEVVVIPTHQPMVREDESDVIYLSVEEKYAAIVSDIKDIHAKEQPILVGTTSIEASEHLSQLLKNANIPHEVLNAKFHEKEAQIIAQAGRPKSVTIATNMAGRGTDIVLGGNLDAELKELTDCSDEELLRRKAAWLDRHDHVVKSGGLYVLGTERHESRRIDNQLRGRSGRQGDPGRSRFYLSLKDSLLRIFGGERLHAMMQYMGVEKGAALQSKMLSRSIEKAQRKVEAFNFDMRKQLLEYDDVANEQRKVIYHERSELLGAVDIRASIINISHLVIQNVLQQFVPEESLIEEWDIAGLEKCLASDFNLHPALTQWLEENQAVDQKKLQDFIIAFFEIVYLEKEAKITAGVMRQLEKTVMLQTLDFAWREHLSAMDYLRQGIHLRGYAQKNPKQEYKRESFELFSRLLDKINYDVISTLSKLEVRLEENAAPIETARLTPMFAKPLVYQHAEINALEEPALEAADAMPAAETITRGQPKIGRNDACPCNSGKKYKQCHGKLG